MTKLSSNTLPTILIIEDDRDTLNEVKETLSDEGFLTLTAENIQRFEELKEAHVIKKSRSPWDGSDYRTSIM